MKRNAITCIITFIISLFYMTLEVIYKFFPSIFNNSFGVDAFLIYSTSSLVLLITTLLINYKIILKGLTCLLHFKRDCNIAFAFASLMGLVQLLSSIIFYFLKIKYTNNLYSVIVVVSFALNDYAELTVKQRIHKNLNFFDTPAIKKSIRVLQDKHLIRKITSNKNDEDICYSQKANSFRNLNRILHSTDLSDSIASNISLFGCLLSIAVGVVSAVLSKDVMYAISSTTICSCMCIPATLKLSSSLPLKKVCSESIKSDAMISGFKSVRKFGEVKSIVINSTDLYRRRKILLQGMKTFNGQKIDEALISASIIIDAVNSPLGHIFSKIVKGKRFSSVKCSDVFYEDEKGIVGMVNDKRVLVGNRSLLTKYKVMPPPYELEKKFFAKNQQITYFAVGNELVAMFVLSYSPDLDLLNDLKRLKNLGITLFVRTVDSNITAELICRDFDLSYDSVKIVPSQTNEFLRNSIDCELEEDSAYAVSFGKAKSLFKVISLCIRAKYAVVLGTVISVVSLILGALIVTFLIFYATIETMASFELLIYILLWTCCVCIVPKILFYNRKGE